MRLWPEEYEGLRAEARELVAEGLAAFTDQVQGSLDGVSREDRVAQARAALSSLDQPVDEADERDVAGVPCRQILPDGDATAVYLHFHGGGMVTGAPVMNDLTNLALAREHGMATLSVDYRLAPEHPWPAGPDDGLAVARWLLEHGAAEYGTDRILIGGESAGGYMAAITTLRIRDELRAADRIAGVNLVFGVFDWGRSPSQRGIRPAPLPDVLDPPGIEWFTDCYVPDRTDDERRDPAISPAYADLTGLPPALFSVGTADHLLDDTLITAGRWAAGGNEVELWVGPDLPHAFPWFRCELTKRWEQITDAWFRRILAA